MATRAPLSIRIPRDSPPGIDSAEAAQYKRLRMIADTVALLAASGKEASYVLVPESDPDEAEYEKTQGRMAQYFPNVGFSASCMCANQIFASGCGCTNKLI